MSDRHYVRVQTVEVGSVNYINTLEGAIKTITEGIKGTERISSLSHQVIVPRNEFADHIALVVAVIHGCECEEGEG